MALVEIRKVILGFVFLAGCSGAAQTSDKGSGSVAGAGGNAGAGGKVTNGPGGHEQPTDVCSNVFIIPDGKCNAASPLAACDPDCSPDYGGGEGGVVNDPCAGVDVITDGKCGPEPECDPDCQLVTPPTDVCSNVFIIPDGSCDPASPYASCDPDCSSSPGAGGAPGGVDDPCAGVDYIPDGKCDGTACDPDCHAK